MPYRIGILSTLTLCLLGCPEAERSTTTPPASRERCSEGLAFCDGNVAKQCDDKGYVGSEETCATTQVCVAGVCESNIVCQANERLCVQNVLKICNSSGTGFESDQDCGSDICANGDCQDPGSNTCPPNALYCVDNTAYHCNADGTGLVTDPQACGSLLCVNGTCEALVCSPGFADCSDQTARTCNALGTGYSVVEACVAPETCVAGRCRQMVCSPGVSCSHNIRITCNDQGTEIINELDCTPQICANGACISGQNDAGQNDVRQNDVTQYDAGQNDGQTADVHTPDGGQLDTSQGDATGPTVDGAQTDITTADSAQRDHNRADNRMASPDSAQPDTTVFDVPVFDVPVFDTTAFDSNPTDTTTVDSAARPDAWRADTASSPDATAAPCADGDNDNHGRGSGCLGRDCDDTRGDVYAGAVEYADGVDNDCDGSIDEGLACSPQAPAKPCPSAGACAGNSGIEQNCVGGTWSQCPISASDEICDGVDNDCNSTIDDIPELGEVCAVGIGVCQRQGHLACDGEQQSIYCDAGNTNVVGIEACNNSADDDCDGDTDESDCCPLRTSVDPSSQLCRRDERGYLCQACSAGDTCGSNLDFCVLVDDPGQTCSGTGQGTCPSADYVCHNKQCYWDTDCSSGGTCQGSLPGLIPGTCSVGVCTYTVCGVDCSNSKPCPAGYACHSIITTSADCQDGSCPANDCTNKGTSDSPNYLCRTTNHSCGSDDPCPQLNCVDGRCEIGRNCLPARGTTCSQVPANPPCGSGCGEGAHCDTNQCLPNTNCSNSELCPLGYKCTNGNCQSAERCSDNSDCQQPSFFCNSGYCDNAVPCAHDGECPGGTFCDLHAVPATCTPGCRLSSPSGCSPDHYCASNHRCYLTQINPGGRCSSCGEQNPCTEANTFCHPLTGTCTLFCWGDGQPCRDQITFDSECWAIGCTNPDCP